MRLMLLIAVLAAGCGGDDIDSDAEARRAYLGFDRAIDRAIGMGFAGFNAASSANIPPQSGVGDVAGTIDVTGQVDQGTSANKEMRLDLLLTDYEDGPVDDPVTEDVVEELMLAYTTDPLALPRLVLSLRDIPNGTFTGSLMGDFTIVGSLNSAATFNLSLSGNIQEDPQTPGDVIREPGTLAITGTVTSGDGTYEVNVTQL